VAGWLAERCNGQGEPILWTVPKLVLAIEAEFGIVLGKTAAWELVRQPGFRQKAPRPQHAKADKQAQESFKKPDEEVRDFISSPNNLVFLFDESRFGLQPSIGRCWARKGVRVSAPVNSNYQNFYAYSGVSPFTGDAFSLFPPGSIRK
jgi:hypothetical protein